MGGDSSSALRDNRKDSLLYFRLSTSGWLLLSAADILVVFRSPPLSFCPVEYVAGQLLNWRRLHILPFLVVEGGRDGGTFFYIRLFRFWIRGGGDIIVSSMGVHYGTKDHPHHLYLWTMPSGARPRSKRNLSYEGQTHLWGLVINWLSLIIIDFKISLQRYAPAT